MTQDSYPGLDKRVSVIERDAGIMGAILERIEASVGTISRSTTSIDKLLAVHDQKLKEHSDTQQQILSTMDRRKDESRAELAEVTRKMDEFGKELRAEISELGGDLKSSMEGVRVSQKQIADKLDQKIQNVEVERERQSRDLDLRIRSLENWRWVLVGGGAALGFLVSRWSALTSMVGSLFGAGG